MIVKTGIGLTVIVETSVFVHPLVDPVTVKLVVVAGDPVTVAPLVELNPALQV